MSSGRVISIEDDGDEGLRFDSYTSKRYTLAVQTMVGRYVFTQNSVVGRCFVVNSFYLNYVPFHMDRGGKQSK